MNLYLYTQLPLLMGFAMLLLMSSFWPKSSGRFSHTITLVALAVSAMLTASLLDPGQEFFGGAIRVTVIGKVMAYACLGLAMLAVTLAESYLAKVHIQEMDFRLVVLAQALGLSHLPLAGDLATLFIAFELVSVSAYILAGFNHRDARANESGMKYLVLGIFGSALFLLGITFLYGATGEIHLAAIQGKIVEMMAGNQSSDLVLVRVSLVFFMGALFFKNGIAPFHFWLSDVYAGTNMASLGFLAAPAKVATFGLLGLLLWGPFAPLNTAWTPILLVVAAACAVFGNLQAILQTRLKRILAYSSVSNAGFILLSLLLDKAWAFMFYLVAYGFATLGMMAAFMALGTATSDVDEIEDLRGMGAKHPWVSTGLTWMLFSLAGIPLTAGFAAKFAIISEGLKPGMVTVPGLIPVLVMSVMFGLISFFFYFKIVRALWLPHDEMVPKLHQRRDPEWNPLIILGFCSLAILFLGILMRLPGTPIGN